MFADDDRRVGAMIIIPMAAAALRFVRRCVHPIALFAKDGRIVAEYAQGVKEVGYLRR